MINTIHNWNIRTLIDCYNQKRINLNPPYQRNDIWSLPAKKRLIDTILIGYPLPSFFLYKDVNGNFEVVDGQQRIRTILGFFNGLFTTLDRKKYTDFDYEQIIDNYQLPIVLIEQVDKSKNESLEDFYFRVNNFGIRLNRPEILKSRYFDNPLQSLVENIADSDEFKNLNLFTDSTLNRMIDYDFVGELITLLKVGLFDKKIAVDRLYEDDSFTNEVARDYEIKFYDILKVFIKFNELYPISETRYRQRNDFFTLFHFINNNINLDGKFLNYCYKILVLIGPDIFPSNEKCISMQEYAFNCVSQSNSKNARQARLDFLNSILLNKYPKPISEAESDNYILSDVMHFYNFENDDLVQMNNYYLLDIRLLQEHKSEIKLFSDEV